VAFQSSAETLRQYETKTSYVLKDEFKEEIYNVTVDSVLVHHGDTVSSVRFGKEPGTLLSASFDFTVCLWKQDTETGVWGVQSTMGAMTGNKHAYFDALFLSPDAILAYTFTGALHLWMRNPEGYWTSHKTVNGHFAEVCDLEWDAEGHFLVTCSLD